MYGVFGQALGAPGPDLDRMFEAPELTLWRPPERHPVDLWVDDDRVAMVCGRILNLPAQSVAAGIAELDGEGALEARLPDLDGTFALLLFEREPLRLRLVSDRYGSLPWFHGRRGERYYFAPRLDAFARSGFDAEIDAEFATSMLAFGYEVRDATPLRGVAAVPPGSIVSVDPTGAKADRYWTWRFDEGSDESADPEAPVERAAPVLGQAFVRAVERRTAHAPEIIVPLSGGLDSRAILGALVESREAAGISTATFGTPGTLDFELGCRVARHVGTRHRIIDLSRGVPTQEDWRDKALECGGLAECANGLFPYRWSVLSAAGRDVAVGYLGDPLMGSHLDGDLLAIGTDGPSPEQGVVRNFRVSAGHTAGLLGLHEADLATRLSELVAEGDRENPQHLTASRLEWWDFRHRQLKFSTPHVFLRREIFEYTSPFLDNDLVDWMLAAPASWRVGQALYRRMLVESWPRLFAMPVKNTGGRPLAAGHVAGSGLWRRVAGALRGRVLTGPLGQREGARFRGLNHIDHASLLRGDSWLRDMAGACCRRLVERGVVNADAVRNLWHAHGNGSEDHSLLLRRLVSLELAYDLWGERELPPR